MNAQLPLAYPQPGDVIDGKYRVERLLGEGGMGAVARATHLLRRAPVALKFMSPAVMTTPGAVERFLNEGVAASQIDSENVVKIYDVGTLPNGSPFLVMECLDGEDLSELLKREGSPGLSDLPRCIHFVLQVLRALQVAHDAGIVHRDMKPSNCFVIQKDGEPDFVKLLDFGISKVRHPGGVQLTRTNSTMGTPLYMAPEQAMNARIADARSDLYSTTAILYELLSGRTPYVSETGEVAELFYQLFTKAPASLLLLRPDLPQGLGAVVEKGLAREPTQRFPTASAMCEALLPWADARSAQVVARIRHRAAGSAVDASALSSAVPAMSVGAPSQQPPDPRSVGFDRTLPLAQASPPRNEPAERVSAPSKTTGSDATVGLAVDRPRRKSSSHLWFVAAFLVLSTIGGAIVLFARSTPHERLSSDNARHPIVAPTVSPGMTTAVPPTPSSPSASSSVEPTVVASTAPMPPSTPGKTTQRPPATTVPGKLKPSGITINH
jgi:serine/threonine-protein kinase